MRYSRQAGLVFALLAFLYCYFYQDPAANGNTRLDLAFSIVQQGRLNIDSYVSAPGTSSSDRSFYNGHYYADKDIGSSLLAAIFYAPLYLLSRLTHHQFTLMQVKYYLTILVISLPSAFAGSLVYLVCESLSGSRLRALLATLAVTLGTMVLPFSAIFFGHQLAGSFSFAAFFLIYQLKLRPELRLKWGYNFLIGILLGAAFLTDYTTAVIVLALGLYYLYIVRPQVTLTQLSSTVIPLAVAALIPVVIMMIYDTLSFGSPFSIGYSNLGNSFKYSMSQGLFGIGVPKLEVLFYITLHPAMGIFWQAPVLLLAVLGFYFMLRDPRFRIEGLVVLFVFAAYLLITSGYFFWWGGFSFTPRFLIPMLLFMALPLVMLPPRLDFLVIILAAISIFQMFIPTASTSLVPDGYFTKSPHHKFWGFSTIYSYSWQQLLAGKFTYNLGTWVLSLKRWSIFIPIILAITAVVATFISIEQRCAASAALTVAAAGTGEHRYMGSVDPPASRTGAPLRERSSPCR